MSGSVPPRWRCSTAPGSYPRVDFPSPAPPPLDYYEGLSTPLLTPSGPSPDAQSTHKDDIADASLGPHLDETYRCEVAIEGEGLCHTTSPHHREARRVDKGIFPLVAAPEPFPGFGFLGICDPMDREPRGIVRCVEEVNSRTAAEATSQESPGFPKNVVGRQEVVPKVAPQDQGLLVVDIALRLESDPERAIDEPHRP